MTAPSYNTWDGDPSNGIAPRRPSTADVGGDTVEDEADFPPDPLTMPTAGGHNQKSKQIASLAKTASPAKLTIRFNAGAPFIFKATFAGADLDTSGWVTDAGVGITEIVWPADTFPPHAVDPYGLTCNNEVGMGCAESITNGIRVSTEDHFGAPKDIDFTICIG